MAATTTRRAGPAMIFALLCLAATGGSFVGGLWAALAIGGGIALYAVQTAQSGLQFPSRWLGGITGATLLLLAAEVPWAQDAARSFPIWGKLASIFLPLLLLFALTVPQQILAAPFFKRLALALGVTALVLSAELASGGLLLQAVKRGAPLTDYNRGMAHATIFLFPILGGLWCAGQKRATVLLALVMLFPASLTESRTAKMAMIAGYAVVALAAWRPFLTRNLLYVTSLLSLAFPFAVQSIFAKAPAWVQALPPSWLHRFEIWDYLSYRIAERPWLGWGLGSTKYLDFTQPHGTLYHYAITNAPHAHNFVTQTWVETGVPGLGCLLVFLILTIRAAARLPRPLSAFAFGGWTAAFAVSLCGFDFWTDALWSCFALSAFTFGVARQTLEGRQDAAHTKVG